MRKKEQKSKLLADTNGMDWCMRARKVAFKVIEARGMTHKMEDLVTVKKKKKNNNKNKKNLGKKKIVEKIKDFEDDLDYSSEEDLFSQTNGPLDDVGDLKWSISLMVDGMFAEKMEKAMEEIVHKLSQFSGPSDHRKEINLNKAIMEAQTAEQSQGRNQLLGLLFLSDLTHIHEPKFNAQLEIIQPSST